MTNRILVVEDQEDIGALIVLNLQSLDFKVHHAKTGNEGLMQARSGDYDLIVLDIMLPGIDGLEICKTLRQESNYSPILMLTARKSEADRVVGLEVGADDYLTKPFSVRELQARVKALLRRAAFFIPATDQDKPEDIIAVGPLRIDKEKRRVSMNAKEVQLTAKEFDLLLYLAIYPGKVFTREQLLNAVWGYQHNGYEHTVNSHINRLRSKIESDPAHPEYVITVWGVGYKFYDY
ncbi:MAG: response regulator transcription factor [Cellvibrionaceae bacterium]|nr:response regulator transcription factor [Cellvibrionaceae bacterium]